ncbi:MAG: ATP-dependent helicase HrpB [Verrucomicrobiales bacterium]
MEKCLPIWEIAADVLDTLRGQNRLVLVAPTGSGKSTQVPQIVLDQLSPPGKPLRIVVLQPRRVAARTLAARVASERNSRVGKEVGYQIRFEDRTNEGTLIRFVTEGILLRWLQDDPNLSDIDILIFDEFHERNLLSDVSLGLAKNLQQTKRPDLKIIVMSATLDADPISVYLGNCPILTSQGQTYGVEVRYLDYSDSRPFHEQAAAAVEKIVHSGEEGDILVFMPGMSEINATLTACKHLRLNERLALIPLHGELPPEEQDKAFAPNSSRKVVAATNVAETSITIPGIRHVVDGGLARIARYDSERGIGTLFLEEISRASADQRKGRAGRTAPGTCTRLWTESNHLNRPERNTPEIQRSDLAEIVLLLHSLGIKRAAEFDWLDKPDPAAVERAEKLLRLLGALEAGETSASSDLTEVGRKMLRLPMHPRYSRMLLEASKLNCVGPAALCAALVSGRDLLVRAGRDEKHIGQNREKFEENENSDFFVLIQAFQYAAQANFDLETCRRHGIHAATARQVAMTMQQLLDIVRGQNLGDPNLPASSEHLQRSIMTGFIDQLCVRKDKGSLDCLLTEGRTAVLGRESVVQKAPMFVAATIKQIASKQGPLTLLGLATAVELPWVRETFAQHLRHQTEHLYDRLHKRVAAIRITRFLDLVIEQEHCKETDPEAAGLALAEAYLQGAFELPLFNHEIKQWINRANLLARVVPELEFPFIASAQLKEILGAAFRGMTLAKEAQAQELKKSFIRYLGPDRMKFMEELAPASVRFVGEKPLKLTYADQAPESDAAGINNPEIQAKLHECFAATDHPVICEGRTPLKLWLCAPDGKRLEPTTDWPKFRSSLYPKLKPTLQKKYPGFTWL